MSDTNTEHPLERLGAAILGDGELEAEILRLGERIPGHGARAQASAAYGMLALMCEIDFSRFSEDLRVQYIHDLWRWTCYAIAGQPGILRALKAARPELDNQAALTEIVRALAGLFKVDPEPLIAKMLGVELAGVQ